MTPTDRRHSSSQEKRIQQSLRLCWKEGIAAQVMIGIVDYFLIPFALVLGASTAQVGLLVAVPNLLASVLQFLAVQAIRWAGSRLRLLLIGFFIQAVFLLPIGLLAYLDTPLRILILGALVTVYKALGAVMGPAWGSLVSEYLPAQRRGNYFGFRARVVGLSGLANLVLWGLFLYAWKMKFDAATGFVVIFLAASLARMVSLGIMSKMIELPHHVTRESEFTFWMFLRRFKESNFVKFVFFVSGITFATNLASPYFSVHMLRDLHFNYLGYMAVSLSSVVMGLISFPIWGRHADSVGNARILKITSVFIWIIPLLWLFPRSVAPLMLAEMFSGFIWGGFNLCATNFIFDAVTPSKRVRCLGYFNVINGVALFAGASLGGWLGDRLPVLWGYPLLGLFVISAALRFLASFSLARHFQEVRAEAKHVTSSQLFFSVVGIRPILGNSEDMPALAPRRDTGFAKRPKNPGA